MAATSIEWTEATWNPVTGCTRASAGCDLCYAVTMTRRLAAMGSKKYVGLVNPRKNHFNGVVRTHPEALAQPLQRRPGTLWFVNSMSDLFHKDVPFEFIAAVFGVMAATPNHQYQVLTKRPERMVEFFAWASELAVREEVTPTAVCIQLAEKELSRPGMLLTSGTATPWPLPNVWLGTSVEDEHVAERIDLLRAVPAQVRFLSCEPLIGSLDLRGRLDGVHWVIVGGESGPGARPMNPEWVSAIQSACGEAGTAYFFKQTGAVLAKEWGLENRKGSDASEWPEAHRTLSGRAFPTKAVKAT